MIHGHQDNSFSLPPTGEEGSTLSRWLVRVQLVLLFSLLLTLTCYGWGWAQQARPVRDPPRLIRPQVQELQIQVYVQGAVRRPGSYRLPVGARVLDALLDAGGTLPDANLVEMNLVAPLTDGATVLIASTKDKGISSTVKESAPKPSPSPPVRTPRALLEVADEPPRHGKQPPERKVNLNKATAEELAQLPGIGPKMAQDIVSYRQQIGRFKVILELRKIRGIGEKRLKRIKEFVVL